MLGGHVAERLVFDELSTGASNDIERATALARRMVTEFGMSERLGTIAYGKKDEMVFLGREISEQRNYSEEVAVKIDIEVKAIIDEAYSRATDLLTRYMPQMQQIVGVLMEVLRGAEAAAAPRRPAARRAAPDRRRPHQRARQLPCGRAAPRPGAARWRTPAPATGVGIHETRRYQRPARAISPRRLHCAEGLLGAECRATEVAAEWPAATKSACADWASRKWSGMAYPRVGAGL
jgi:hypothetical protein